jgi:alkylated DNA repair dioxygenase AlkB
MRRRQPPAAHRKRNVQSNWWRLLDRFGKLSQRRSGLLCAAYGGDAAGGWEGSGMTADSYAPGAALKRISMPDADVSYINHLPLGQPATQVLQRLIAEIAWRSEEVVMWGRRVPQPRLTAWYGDPGSRYTYSGLQLDPRAWTPLLLDIRGRVEDAAGAAFNSVLLNYYRDHHDSIGFHSDDEPELGAQPVIAALSLGEERTFILKHKTSKAVQPMHLRLASGSLLLMRGDTQHCWRHGILKESRPCGPRVNLTFRKITWKPNDQPGARR